jgi:hypothetical protein
MGVVLEEEAIDLDINTKAIDSLYLRRNSKHDKKLNKEEYLNLKLEK